MYRSERGALGRRSEGGCLGCGRCFSVLWFASYHMSCHLKTHVDPCLPCQPIHMPICTHITAHTHCTTLYGWHHNFFCFSFCFAGKRKKGCCSLPYSGGGSTQGGPIATVCNFKSNIMNPPTAAGSPWPLAPCPKAASSMPQGHQHCRA